MTSDSTILERIYTLVRQIPRGRVASYGQIAAMVGHRVDAREVGRAMAVLPAGSDVPWHRVINSQGGISTVGLRQRELLEAEGVVFDGQGRVDFARVGWEGPDLTWLATHGYQACPPPRWSQAKESPGTQLGLFDDT